MNTTTNRRQLTWRQDLITTLLGAWLIIGLFVDGWAHNNLRELETFFTPWHGLLYSGFLATAVWIMWQAARGYWRGNKGLQAIPVGYGPGFVGIAVFLAGGLGDMMWHIIFGIEQDIAALLSPTHLLLLFGILLMITSPLRSTWERVTEYRPSFLSLLPALLSMTFTAVTLAFFLMYSWKLNHLSLLKQTAESSQIRAINEMILTTILMMGPLFFLLRRWKLPFGSATFLFTAMSGLLSVLISFRSFSSVLVALAAGLAADVLIGIISRDRHQLAYFRAFAFAAPLILWGLYFGVGDRIVGLLWPPEMWSGSIVLCSLISYGMSLLVVPFSHDPSQSKQEIV